MARRTKEEAERTRTAVLNAAADVFLTHGVARATLEDVAQAAGVTRGAIYWHFRNKLDLFLAIDARARLPAEQLVTAMAAYTGEDPLGELSRVLSAELAKLAADKESRCLLTVVLVRCEYTEEMAPALERQRRADTILRAEFQRIFEGAAARSGRLSPPWQPRTASLALHALLTGLISAWLRGPEDLGLATEGVEAVRALLASMEAAAVPAGNKCC